MSSVFVKSAALLLLTLFLFSFVACGDDANGGDTETDVIYVPEETTSDGVLTPEQVPPDTVCFLNSFAKVGVPLTCYGYPDGVTYTWTITHMTNDEVETFEDTTGAYTPERSDLESMITVSVDGYDDLMIYCSELPVLYFSGEAKYKAISKNEYVDVALTMQGNSTTVKGLYEGAAQLRLRGNSTANLDKRPFKLKLETKENMLDMADGKSRHWVLLANAIDHTLMRNKLLYDFSGALGTEYYTKSENVVLIYNGEYYGVYQLCEQIRIDNSRIDIYDWSDAAEDVALALAKKLRDDGEVTSEEYEAKAIEIEDTLVSDWSWVDSGEFKYNKKTYTFEEFGVTLPERTGGYIIEMDFYSRDDSTLSRLESAYRQPLYFSDIGQGTQSAADSFEDTELYESAYKFMQSFEYALHSDDFFFRSSDTHYEATGNMNWGGRPGWGGGWGSGWGGGWGDFEEPDATDNYGYSYNIASYRDTAHDGWHYSDFFDMDSLVNNFIFCEFAMNWDSMKNSFFYYKDVDGKAYIAPQWDFDWAWGNINMYNINTYYPESWHTTEDAFTVEQYYQKVQWNRMLIRDPYFLALVYERYHEVRDTLIEDMIKDGGTIDMYVEDLRISALANDNRWRKTYKSYKGEEYDDAVASMIEFIETRVDWLDEQFESMETLIDSLGYYQTYGKIKVTDVSVGETQTVITASCSVSKSKKVTFQVNGTTVITSDIVDGVATVTLDNSCLNENGVNCVEVKAVNANGEYIYNNDYCNDGVYNIVYSNYKTFYTE